MVGKFLGLFREIRTAHALEEQGVTGEQHLIT